MYPLVGLVKIMPPTNATGTIPISICVNNFVFFIILYNYIIVARFKRLKLLGYILPLCGICLIPFFNSSCSNGYTTLNSALKIDKYLDKVIVPNDTTQTT
jgi:hypothetical protein